MKVKTGIRAPALIDDEPPLRLLDERCQWCGAAPNNLCNDADGVPMLLSHYATSMSRELATRMFAATPTRERN